MRALGALAVSATLLGARPAAAVTFGEDDRRPVERVKGAESGPIGMLFFDAGNGQFAAGTAFLVSPCHVLTAYQPPPAAASGWTRPSPASSILLKWMW